MVNSLKNEEKYHFTFNQRGAGIHSSQNVNELYDLVLRDVLQIMEKYPSRYGKNKEYSLCPRWQYAEQDNRKIHVFAKPSPFVRSQIGTIHVEYAGNQATTSSFSDSVTHTFSLAFQSNEDRIFISAKEFGSLHSVVDQ